MLHLHIFLLLFSISSPLFESWGANADAAAQNSSCVADTFLKCKESSHIGDCGCPCLPKCCPAGKILATGGNDDHHGYKCIDDPNPDKQRLPEPKLKSTIFNQTSDSKPPKFFGGVFPSCYGYGKDWKYEVTKQEYFEVDADAEQEYTLYIKSSSSDANKTLISNFNNKDASDRIKGEPYEKPFMYFCFDILEDTTVALSCPKERLNGTIPKCCPKGEALKEGTCTEDTTNEDWDLYFNGHQYDAEQLMETRHLAHIPTNANISRGICPKKLKAHYVFDAFHVGPDGKLYFVDVHGKMQGIGDFCIEATIDEEDEDQADDYYPDNYDENYDNETYDEGHQDCQKHLEKRTIQLHYCAPKIIELHKCCHSLNQNVNVKGGVCTTDRSTNAPFQLEDKYYTSPAAELVTEVSPTIHDHYIHNLKDREHLIVIKEHFEIDVFGNLNYLNKKYTKENFCLDYSIDYCENVSAPRLSAVLNDKTLHESSMNSHATSVFGGGESKTMRIFKQVGFSVSLFFLFLTLAIHFVVQDMRKELSGKMVICIASSMVGVYICLLIKTFEPESEGLISKTNPMCTLLACSTYFFIMSTFGWMSSMSYNIMKQFGGGSRIHKRPDNKILLRYAIYSFGMAILMTGSVYLTHFFDRSSDIVKGNVENTTLFSIRPGFGEESCWFTTCSSKGLGLFLYGPIIVILLTNIGMFSYAAYILHSLQRNVRKGGVRNKSYQSQTSTNTAATRECLHRQYSRQLSGKVTSAVSDNLKKQKANIERMSTFLKLFVAFGLTWVFEVVAWLISSDRISVPMPLQILLNIANVLQGLIIFFVFGLKRQGKGPRGRGTLKHRYSSRSHSTSSTAGSAASTRSLQFRKGNNPRVSTNPAGRNYRRSVSSELSSSE